MTSTPNDETLASTPADTPTPPPGDEAVGGGAATPSTPAVATPSLSELAEGASIVDTILDLDAFLSGDVRRATKRVYFSTSPDLEARVDELDAELAALVDGTGRPLDDGDDALAGGNGSGRTVAAVQAEYAEVNGAYQASLRALEFEALGDEAYDDFKRKNPALAGQAGPDRDAAFNKLIVASSRSPKFVDDTWAKFRSRVNAAVVDQCASAALYVNTQAGVAVPKSQLFSAVQKHTARARS